MTSTLRRTLPALALAFAGTLAAAPLAADLGLSLAYVDTGSPAYARYKAWVDQAVAGSPGYAFSATDAAYLYRITGQTTYGNLAVTWAMAQVAAAEAAIAASQAPEIAGDSYLEVGPMLRDVALVYAWCPTLLSPTQRTRMEAYADRAIANVWDPPHAQWGGNPFPWSGWSIDNPGNNYHFSFLEATMYWALAANRTSWIQFLSAPGGRLDQLSNYWAAMPGGGSREGTGYGVALMRLFEIYRVWRDSTGVDLAARSSHLADTMTYWVHATVPTRDRYAPIGDLARESYPWLFDYHRNLVLQARAMAPASLPAAHAAAWLGAISIDEMTQGFNFRHDLLPTGAPGTPATERIHHATGAGHLFARTAWTADALWMSVVGGRYDESHAHQDQGAFNLFGDDWLAVTENVWSHSGIEQGVDMHNTLRFVRAGATLSQSEGTTSTMTVSEPNGAILVEVDATAAYAPAGGVASWTRALELDGGALTVRDLYAVDANVAATFLLQLPSAPSITGTANGVVAVAGGLRATVLVPAAPTFTVLDWRSVDPQEFPRGYRLAIGGGTGEYRVRLERMPGLFADGFESQDTSHWD